jgi:hypothetical protein
LRHDGLGVEERICIEGKATLDTAARIQQLVVVTRQATVRYTVHHATSRRKSNSYEDLWALSRPTLAFVSVSQPRTCRCMSTRPGVYKYIPLPSQPCLSLCLYPFSISNLESHCMQTHAITLLSDSFSRILQHMSVLSCPQRNLACLIATWHLFLPQPPFRYMQHAPRQSRPVVAAAASVHHCTGLFVELEIATPSSILEPVDEQLEMDPCVSP